MSAPEAAAEAHGRLQDVAHERRLARAAAAHQPNAGAVTAAAPPRATPRGPTLHMINGRPRAAAVPASPPAATARFAAAASSGSAAVNVISNARPVAGETRAELKERLRELKREEEWTNWDQRENNLITPVVCIIYGSAAAAFTGFYTIPMIVFGGPPGVVVGGLFALGTLGGTFEGVVREQDHAQSLINETDRDLTTIKDAITEVQEQLGNASSNDSSSSDSESGLFAKAESYSAYLAAKPRRNLDRRLRRRPYAI